MLRDTLVIYIGLDVLYVSHTIRDCDWVQVKEKMYIAHAQNDTFKYPTAARRRDERKTSENVKYVSRLSLKFRLEKWHGLRVLTLINSFKIYNSSCIQMW